MGWGASPWANLEGHIMRTKPQGVWGWVAAGECMAVGALGELLHPVGMHITHMLTHQSMLASHSAVDWSGSQPCHLTEA
jgi:hypothetical protein